MCPLSIHYNMHELTEYIVGPYPYLHIYELYVYHIFSVLINYLASEQLPHRIQFWNSLQQFNLLIRAKHPVNTLIISPN